MTNIKVGDRVTAKHPTGYECAGVVVEIDHRVFEYCAIKVRVEGVPAAPAEQWFDGRYVFPEKA